MFRSNCSCEHVENSFDSPTAFVFVKKAKFFCQCPEMKKNLDSFFRRPCWKISDWMPKRVCSVCENVKKYATFFSKKFSLKDPMDTIKAVFKTLPKDVCQKAKSFWLLSDKVKNTYYFFQKKYFSSEFSCGNVRFKIGSPAGSLMTKNWKNLLNKRKWWKSYIFFKKQIP